MPPYILILSSYFPLNYLLDIVSLNNPELNLENVFTAVTAAITHVLTTRLAIFSRCWLVLTFLGGRSHVMFYASDAL